MNSNRLERDLSYKNRRYEVVAYDDSWPKLFEEYAAKIGQVFGEDVSIEHIGSTSVVGLAGKPCIDILVMVQDLKAVEENIAEMASLGFEYEGEFVMNESRLFRLTKDGHALVNVHFFPVNHPHNKEMLGLRDYLRSNPKEVEVYSKLKQDLFLKYPNDYASYRKYKDEYVKGLNQMVASGFCSA